MSQIEIGSSIPDPFEILDLIKSNIPEKGYPTNGAYSVIKNLTVNALKNPNLESSRFLSLLINNQNNIVSSMPTLLSAEMLSNPKEFAIEDRQSDIPGAVTVVKNRIIENSNNNRDSETLFEDFIGYLNSKNINPEKIYVELLNTLPYEKRLPIFAGTFYQIGPEESLTLFEELSDVKKYKDKKSAEEIISSTKRYLVRRLASNGHMDTLRLAEELKNPDYLEIAKTAQENNYLDLAKTARQKALNRAFNKSFLKEPLYDEMVRVVLLSMDHKDWESLEVAMQKDKVNSEIFKWLRVLPIQLTEVLDLSAKNQQEMTKLLRFLFSQNYSDKNIRQVLREATFSLFPRLDNWHLDQIKEDLYLMYPDTTQAQQILAKRKFDTAVENNDFALATSLFLALSLNEQRAAAVKLANAKLRKAKS